MQGGVHRGGGKGHGKCAAAAAGTLLPQYPCPQSSAIVIDEMVSGELPMFRRRTVCGWLVEPINWGEY